MIRGRGGVWISRGRAGRVVGWVECGGVGRGGSVDLQG